MHDEQTENSDIDLIIELEDNTPQIHELKNELREYFSKQFEKNVDVAREKYFKPHVKNEIINETLYVE